MSSPPDQVRNEKKLGGAILGINYVDFKSGWPKLVNPKPVKPAKSKPKRLVQSEAELESEFEFEAEAGDDFEAEDDFDAEEDFDAESEVAHPDSEYDADFDAEDDVEAEAEAETD